jgi:RNA polymerase sigma factor (sigma-70 family)
MNYHDDSYYITLVLQGNTDAFSFLVEKHKRMAYTLALKLVHVPQDAEDIAQDSFIKAFQALDQYRGESKFSTWLYKIVYNISIAKLRKKQLITIEIDNEQNHISDVSETENFLTQLTIEEQNDILRNAIDQLPAGEKALITLYYMNDCTIKEITQITEETESNIKIKLFRARRKLWDKLKVHFSDKITVEYEEQ